MTHEPNAWPAPAKLNLLLRITGRRADGYHELQTVFQLLDWGDQVIVAPSHDGTITRTTEIPGVPRERDLGLRAAKLLRQACGVRQGARITVIKNIPAGGGLGGASSDAATVLHALNVQWGCGLDVAELAGIGLNIGADVPLFVRGFSAFAEGVGDQLQPLKLGQRFFLLLFPGIEISTAGVFSDPALRRDSPPREMSYFLENQDANTWRNDCEAVILRRHPELETMLHDARGFGRPRMTGTGSTFFIEMESKIAADEAAHALKNNYNVRAVGGVDRSVLQERLSTGSTGR